jgi:hypothetical protein
MGVCEDIDSAWFETVSSTKQYLAIRKATESTQVPHIVLIAAPPIRLPGDVYAYIGWVNALRSASPAHVSAFISASISPIQTRRE